MPDFIDDWRQSVVDGQRIRATLMHTRPYSPDDPQYSNPECKGGGWLVPPAHCECCLELERKAAAREAHVTSLLKQLAAAREKEAERERYIAELEGKVQP